MSIKILHIVIDDKFIDGAIDVFDNSSASNTYVILDHFTSYTFIKRHTNKIRKIEKKDFFQEIYVADFDIIAFHTLDRYIYDFVLQLPLSIKVLWLAWGYDIYESYLGAPPVIPISLYKLYTKRVVKSLNRKPLYKWLKHTIKTIFFEILLGRNIRLMIYEKKLQDKVISRIDYMSTVLYSEYKMLCQLPKFRAEYFPFQYVEKNDYKDMHNYVAPKKNNILLGNSATPENNHIDVLRILKKRKIKNQCLVPISYGDEKYRKYIKKYFKKCGNITFLDKFISLENYKKILASCKVGIFGHIRQQALGNIVICMRLGMKLFFFEDSIAYKFLKENGFVVYSIEYDLTIQSINECLKDSEMLINLKKIDEIFNFSNVLSRLNQKIDMIINER